MNINNRIKKLEQTCVNNEPLCPKEIEELIDKGVYYDELTEEQQKAYEKYAGITFIQFEQILNEDENISHFKLVRPYQDHPLKDKRKERERIEGIIKELEEAFGRPQAT